MLERISLEGTWKLQLDGEKRGLQLPYWDTIDLPNTTSHAGKGKKNEAVKLGALTDEYTFEGYAWFAREIDIPEHLAGQPCYLFLERTRVTTLWIGEEEIGTQNSLSTPHRYELTGRLGKGRNKLTIRVDNTGYPTKGGHLTSGDTQTNWNGITGRMELQFYADTYLDNMQAYPKLADRAMVIKADLVGDGRGKRVAVSAESVSGGGQAQHVIAEQVFEVSAETVEATFEMGQDARLWSDEHPSLYKLKVSLLGAEGERLDTGELIVGLREFKAAGDKFTINGTKTMLRGKHDGLIFPLTGYAPTDVAEWLRVLGISKSYGINHYRFHTCCPPEAAFIAADMLGVYMEPELPFWGTITDDTYENHNQTEQDYLIGEGYAMLDAYGNHPSFVMMSLGNELWGSKSRLNDILKKYKAFDDRHLYTQGSNNFQFVPDILEQEDFFCGVRFSKDRLFRGSYAMCDAPQGHVQTDRPGTMKDYDEQIVPSVMQTDEADAGEELIQIQYGTEARSVKAAAVSEGLIPRIPVLSHEIGQYAFYPNFDETAKYTGPLKARNLAAFRERLEAKGMGHLAGKFFESTGKLAVACYKEELEAAFRSRRLAGFQLLDLQDFSGQGTALVGILDAFMDSKGFISPEEWRSFCSDAVLLARFEKYNYEAGEAFEARVELSCYREEPLGAGELHWELRGGDELFASGEAAIPPASAEENHIGICDIRVSMPNVAAMTKAVLSLSIAGTDIWKTYDIWIYPWGVSADLTGIRLFTELTDEAVSLLEQGRDILLLPRPDRLSRSIEGTYCTDFWCYPMFRSISESMNKPVPIGTMGLLIDKEHPALKHFPSEAHSTYPWWSIVSGSSSIIMDEMPRSLEPIVQTIDNFERNHKLGLLFECRVLNGRALVSALDYEQIVTTPEGRQFLLSVTEYMRSDDFHPKAELGLEELRSIF